MLEIAIEFLRQKLNNQIQNKDTYDSILKTSQDLDKILNVYYKLNINKV